MCQCASCDYTDRYAGLPDLFGFMPWITPPRDKANGRALMSFWAWPRGNPAGRKSASEYSAHASFGKRTSDRLIAPFSISPEPVFSTAGLVMPVARNMSAIRWNALQKQTATEAAAARPVEPAKARQHFPERDRTPETARIYTMPKPEKKRSVGRPAMPGRRVVVKLEEEQIKRAEKLGGGNIALGIRKALAQSSR